MKKYRLAAVSFANTLPFIEGLHAPGIRERVETIVTPPASCARLLEEDQVDFALCPVGALPNLGAYQIISDYCIGCDGPVRTVAVFSAVPRTSLRRIVLSSESRSSNLLVQILEQEYWRQDIEFRSPDEVDPGEETGYLHIGDRCFDLETRYAYATDLGAEWKQHTGMPFAFACWVSRREIDPAFIADLNAAFAEGINRIDELGANYGPGIVEIRKYLHENISFSFDERKHLALQLFLEKVNSLSQYSASIPG